MSDLKSDFKLNEIEEFDARRGYERCTILGVVTHANGMKAMADFWKDHNRRLVIRFSSLGYKYHLEGQTSAIVGLLYPSVLLGAPAPHHPL